MVDESVTPPGEEAPTADPVSAGEQPPWDSGQLPAEEMGPGAGFVPPVLIVLIAVLATLTAAVVLYSLWAFWPTTTSTPKQPPYQKVDHFGWQPTVSRDTLYFLVVALGGALGGLIHTIRSMSWYAGNRMLRWSWLLFYLMLPVVGVLAGTVFYVVLRAGLFSSSSSDSAVNAYGFTAVAVMAGLFSEQAMEKLKQLATEIFSERPQGEDHVEHGNAPAATDDGS